MTGFGDKIDDIKNVVNSILNNTKYDSICVILDTAYPSLRKEWVEKISTSFSKMAQGRLLTSDAVMDMVHAYLNNLLLYDDYELANAILNDDFDVILPSFNR